jgi:hypothetical protein
MITTQTSVDSAATHFGGPDSIYAILIKGLTRHIMHFSLENNIYTQFDLRKKTCLFGVKNNIIIYTNRCLSTASIFLPFKTHLAGIIIK